jgi:secreted PhoX family phosphatase
MSDRTLPNPGLDRRRFLGVGAASLAGGALLTGPFAGLAAAAASAAEGRPPRTAGPGEGGYGPLRSVGDTTNRGATLALPVGFSFAMFGVEDDPMSDGNPTPRAHDGMGAFGIAPGVTRLVRNHEVRDAANIAAPLGGLGNPKAYDPAAGAGNTTLQVRTNPADGSFVALERDFVSLSGTYVNCAGGETPWGSWISSEETTVGEAQGYTRDHGYNFEIPASADDEVTPVPLKAMGRFVHEAVAVDPRTGIVYQTEDRGTAGFYRFVPDEPGNLAAGGRLEMLKVKGTDGYDTRTGQTVARSLPVEWVLIDDPDPAGAETNAMAVYNQGAAKGGATFARLEGIWYGNGSIFFASTSGGEVGEGQVWEYRPSGRSGGQLVLVFESPSEDVLDNPDNLNVTPRGGVLLCEDGDLDPLYLRGLTRDGKIFDFCANEINGREWCGACWSADGKTLFVNIQGDTRGQAKNNLGMTLAIWGPWQDGAL